MSEHKKFSWEARHFSEDDFPNVADFRKSFDQDPSVASFRVSTAFEYHRWRMMDNPKGRGEMSLAVDGGKIVGTASITPKRMVVSGQAVAAAETGETHTDSDYQRQGIFTKLVSMNLQRAKDRGIQLIYGTLNQNSLPGYEGRLGFRQVASVRLINTIRPLRIRRSLKARFESRVLSLVATPAVSTYFRLRFPLLRPLGAVTRYDSLPAEVSDFCKEALLAFDLYLVRDRQYLSWRYDQNPDDYRIYVLRDDGRVTGYLVAKPGMWGALRAGYIADYLTYTHDMQAFSSLLSAAIRDFLEDGIDLVSCWVNKHSPFYSEVKRRRFTDFRYVPIICLEEELGQTVLEKPYRWHFTMADSDNNGRGLG